MRRAHWYRPELYHELMEMLPAEIDRLWDAGAPLPEFKAVVARWAEAHRRVVATYHDSRPGPVPRATRRRGVGGIEMSTSFEP